MKTRSRIPVLAMMTALVTFAATTTNGPLTAGQTEMHGRTSGPAYHDLWRKLWEDHITWTRMVIMGVFDNLPGLSAYQARLLQNYEDMEDALKPYYGDEAEQLGDLIKDHLTIAVEILTAAKAGNTSAFNDAVARWYANGQDIANLMAQMNPKYWRVSMGGPMWREHLDATLNEAVKHLTNDFAGDVAAYDQVHMLALEMADFFSSGVMRQFRNRFTVLR